MKRPSILVLTSGKYKLKEDFTFSNSEGTWTVPAGFTFNGASVPRIPFVHAIFGGKAIEASCLHDFLYKTKPCSRKTADKAFLIEMKRFNNPKFSLARHSMYHAVRTFGWAKY